MITTLVRRVLPLFAIAAVLGWSIRRVRMDRPELDTWFHLRMGREFLSDWPIHDPGHLGVYDSADWVSTQWLSQLGMAGMERAVGVSGVFWLSGVVQLVLVVVVYLGCRRTTSPLPAAFATAAAMLAASPGLSARPQVISYLFVAVTVLAWLASSRDGRVRWWLVATAWLWSTTHGSWPLATIIGGVALLGILLDGEVDRARIRPMAAVVALSALVPLASPLGPDVYRGVLTVSSRSEYFAEWRSTDFGNPDSIVIVLMLTILVVHMSRHRRGWTQVLLTLLAAGWAIYSARTVSVAALIAAPLVAQAVQQWVPKVGRPSRAEVGAVLGLFGLSLAVLTIAMATRPAQSVVPAWVDERLDALPDDSGVLNDWPTGSYFLWSHPDLSFVMHGYGDVFTDEEIERNWKIQRLEPGWRELVDELDADAALVQPDTPLGYALLEDEAWTVVEEDDEFAFLVPSR